MCGAPAHRRPVPAVSSLSHLKRLEIPVSYIHCSGNWDAFVGSVLLLSQLQVLHIKACMPEEYAVRLCRGLFRLSNVVDLQIRYPESMDEADFNATLRPLRRLRRLYVLVDFDVSIQNKLSVLLTKDQPHITELTVADGYNCDTHMARRYRQGHELAVCLNTQLMPELSPSAIDRLTVLQIFMLDRAGCSTPGDQTPIQWNGMGGWR